MSRLGLSRCGTALLRAILDRVNLTCDRILLTEARTVDWQSLTFIGERHAMVLRILEPDSIEVVRRLSEGISEAEFALPGQIVADVAISIDPQMDADESVILIIKALTIAE